MEERAKRYLNELMERYPALIVCRESILMAFDLLAASFREGKKLLVAGNGGSAADAEHLVGELMKGFELPRSLPPELKEKLRAVNPELGNLLAEKLQQGLPAIALDGHGALTTATLNDLGHNLAFAQQVMGYGQAGDVFLGISTSGKSRNVLQAATAARAKGLKVIGLTGEADSPLAALCDVCIRVPASGSYRVQELHLPVYHCLCLMLEETFFGGDEA